MPAVPCFRRSRLVPSIVLAVAPLAVVVGPATAARADPLPQHATEVVHYRISVKLDPATHKLTGRERVTWRNPSADPVTDLWFHLYLNAFKNSKSTFVRESGGQLRGDQMAKDGWGWIDVTSLVAEDGTDLKPGLRFEQPDDGNRDDQTVARVPCRRRCLPAAA